MIGDGSKAAVGAVAGLALVDAFTESRTTPRQIRAKTLLTAISCSGLSLYTSEPNQGLILLACDTWSETITSRQVGACGERLALLRRRAGGGTAAAEREILRGFTQWVSSLQFPLTVFKVEPIGNNRPTRAATAHWVTDEHAAARLLRKNPNGALITGVVKSPYQVQWASTIDLFLAHSAGIEPAHEIVPSVEIGTLRKQRQQAAATATIRNPFGEI